MGEREVEASPSSVTVARVFVWAVVGSLLSVPIAGLLGLAVRVFVWAAQL